MSIRQRKKLLQNDEILQQQSEESDESELTPRKINNFELVRYFHFLLLRKKQYFCNKFLKNILQLSASEREDDNETTEMENLSIKSQPKDMRKKKKNKKKRKIGGGGKSKISSEDQDQENDEIEDEITRTVRLVDKMFGSTSHHHHHHHHHQGNQQTELEKAEQLQNVLYIQNKNLNPQTEVKRMFGKVVNQEQQKKRRGAGNIRSLRTVTMTNPKDNWPPITRTGLSMNLVAAPEGETLSGNEKKKNLLYFTFEHSLR